jgi:carbamoyl-phosphate synthase small subunit
MVPETRLFAGIVREVSELIKTGIPMFGICLGHQLIGRAMGGEPLN